MDYLGPTAVVACFASLGVKWIFAFRLATVERSVEEARKSYQEAKREVNSAIHQTKILTAEQRQYEAQSKTSRRNIARNDQTYKKLAEQANQEEQTKARQKELLEQTKKVDKD